jgi:hypothetical protein
MTDRSHRMIGGACHLSRPPGAPLPISKAHVTAVVMLVCLAYTLGGLAVVTPWVTLPDVLLSRYRTCTQYSVSVPRIAHRLSRSFFSDFD